MRYCYQNRKLTLDFSYIHKKSCNPNPRKQELKRASHLTSTSISKEHFAGNFRRRRTMKEYKGRRKNSLTAAPTETPDKTTCYDIFTTFYGPVTQTIVRLHLGWSIVTEANREWCVKSNDISV
ncbi:hypothetical protein TNCV_1070191 [Trichonephila clavipes]|nr:hypothetical protein TNCV_1070191 [Trichonephila clavipes]